jgi:hypothetical protein
MPNQAEVDAYLRDDFYERMRRRAKPRRHAITHELLGAR